MALRDHSLDGKIIQAAKSQFLEHGYQKASLHQIARLAGITTGALYTRYKSKDDLFCSLIAGMFSHVQEKSASLQQVYAEAQKSGNPEKLLEAIRREEKIYQNLLFEHYDECVLFFCKSSGSSIERTVSDMMDIKSRETVAYLKHLARHPFSEESVELIMREQFHMYKTVLEKAYDRETAGVCMEEMMAFLEAGWKMLFEKIMKP